MELAPLDLLVFGLYALALLAIVVAVSRREETAADYFLAGRNLGWWVIGASLIGSNISAEHFVGMSGSGFAFGLAVASYEWMAAVTLVVVGRWFLPVFLRHGIYTMPEYLELRYSPAARRIFAVLLVLAMILVALSTTLAAGAKAITAIFGLSTLPAILVLTVVGGAYTIYGGLKAVVFTDVLQVVFLLLGGVLGCWLGLQATGGLGALMAAEPDRFHTILAANHPEFPWVGVFFGGLWVANFYYWGCNQFITQRTLAARSLAQGQRGILLAATIKLAIPFLVVVPGIAAFQLYGDTLPDRDFAYPHLLKALLPPGLAGLMLAALLGAVLSSVDSMLNSTSTILTMDLYRVWRPRADEARLMRVGRWCTGAVVVLAALWAPVVASYEGGVFRYIQEAWGFFTPGVLVAFVLGLAWRGASPAGAYAALLGSIPLSLALKLAWPDLAFLNRMGLVFLLLLLLAIGASRVWPGRRPAQPVGGGKTGVVDLTPARGYGLWGGAIVLAVAALYWFFR